MSTSENRQTIIALYDALARRDGKAMGKLYHPEATFQDPVFGALTSSEVGQMWTMLTQQGKDLEFQLVRAEADGDSGVAEWEAKYTFGKTGKKVHNRVRSEFQFRDGLIQRQRDQFDLWKWTGMALGLPGRLLGWTSFLHNAVRKNAKRSLEHFSARQEQASHVRP